MLAMKTNFAFPAMPASFICDEKHCSTKRTGRSSGRRAAGEEMHEKRHRPARRALVVVRRGSRDVEVHPRIALGEPRQEARRGDRAVAVRADVCEIRDVRLERILI